MAELTALLAEGRVRHNVAERFPMERIVEAHERVESGKALGNVVLDIG
ncbi:MAG: zinc-binding dehydrogenase [Panacagrimonas sp.]